VVIADDSPLVVRAIEQMLTEAGFEVSVARDGLSAIEQVLEAEPQLVVLDVAMPRMSGYQACRLLKTDARTREIPVVILTTRDQAGDRFWGLQTGADYYLTKDENPTHLLSLVKRVLDGCPVPPRTARGAGQNSVDILSRVNDLLDRKLYEATILTELGRAARVEEFDRTFVSVMTVVNRVVDFTVGSLAFVESGEVHLLYLLQRPAATAAVRAFRSSQLEALRRAGVATERLVERSMGPVGDAAEEAELPSFASFPVTSGDRQKGMLCLGGQAGMRIERDSEGFLSEVANLAHVVTENSRLFERVRDLSLRDGLTGLFNHRHTMELVAQELSRVDRYQGVVSLLMVDLDHFKRINDEHGHQAGDVALKEVARLIQDSLRNVDIVGRYGGEEFLAILPGTQEDAALRTAERLRASIEKLPIHLPSESDAIHVTASFGVATCRGGNPASASELIRRADTALYEAKQQGRNRVLCREAPGPEPTERG